MNAVKMILTLTCLVLTAGCARFGTPYVQTGGPEEGELWKAVHVLNYASNQDLDTLAREIPTLAEMGLNVLVFEIDYDLEFKSHPELIRAKNLVELTQVAGFLFAKRPLALDAGAVKALDAEARATLAALHTTLNGVGDWSPAPLEAAPRMY